MSKWYKSGSRIQSLLRKEAEIEELLGEGQFENALGYRPDRNSIQEKEVKNMDIPNCPKCGVQTMASTAKASVIKQMIGHDVAGVANDEIVWYFVCPICLAMLLPAEFADRSRIYQE